MSEENRGGTSPASAARVTRPEPAYTEKPDGGWQMPEPVFRQSSGYLPQGFANRPESASESSAVVPAAAAEPQPDISEVIASEPAAPAKNRGSITAILVAAGLLLIAAVAVAFLAVVYYIFLAAPVESTF